MTIETELLVELKSLVEVYATVDAQTGAYGGDLTVEQRARLERSFNQLLIKYLLHDYLHHNGLEKDKISDNYKKLQPLLAMKTNRLFAAEITWIESVLSAEGVEELASKMLLLNYQKLTSPENFKNIQFNNRPFQV